MRLMNEVTKWEASFPGRGSGPYFQGRNGYGLCRGLEFRVSRGDFGPDNLILSPLTSRGTIARCFITIPPDGCVWLRNMLNRALAPEGDEHDREILRQDGPD